MRTSLRVLLVCALLAFVLALGAAAGPEKPDHLGRFALGDALAWTWPVAADDPLYPPHFSFYRQDGAEWSGLFHGPFDRLGPDLYGYALALSPYLGFADGERYMICGETLVAGEPVYAFWTFAISGRGNRPVKADLTACP